MPHESHRTESAIRSPDMTVFRKITIMLLDAVNGYQDSPGGHSDLTVEAPERKPDDIRSLLTDSVHQAPHGLLFDAASAPIAVQDEALSVLDDIQGIRFSFLPITMSSDFFVCSF